MLRKSEIPFTYTSFKNVWHNIKAGPFYSPKVEKVEDLFETDRREPFPEEPEEERRCAAFRRCDSQILSLLLAKCFACLDL